MRLYEWRLAVYGTTSAPAPNKKGPLARAFFTAIFVQRR